MNIGLWVMQVLLAMHTAMGAVWKLYNPEQSVGSLSGLPHGVWTGMSALELVLSVALIVPAVNKSLGKLAPIAAAAIAVEMVAMTGVHLSTGAAANGQVVYWLVVAVFCGALAYGRFVLKPLT